MRRGEETGMNIIIGILLILSVIGLLDKVTGNHLGFEEEFDSGLSIMGSTMLSILGIYCIGITFAQAHVGAIQEAASLMPFDPSILVGSLLSCDLGGFAISDEIAQTPLLGAFSGVVVASSLGVTISFQLPLFLSSLSRFNMIRVLKGLILGIAVLPLSFFASGLLLRVPMGQLACNLLPVLALCGGLVFAVVAFPSLFSRILILAGNAIKLVCALFFIAVAAGFFIPSCSLVDQELVYEAATIVIKMTIIVCGSMILSKLVLKRCPKAIAWIAEKLDINEAAAIGLLVSLCSSLSMLPLYGKMDRKGKLINLAFSVSGAYVIGGQLAFISSLCSGSTVLIFILSKLLGGGLAIGLAQFVTSSAFKEVRPLRGIMLSFQK